MIVRSVESYRFNLRFAVQLRRSRIALSMTVKQVLDQLQKRGVYLNYRSYQKIEDGLRPLHPLELFCLANILNIDLEAFMSKYIPVMVISNRG